MTPIDRFLAEVARRNADAGPEVLASALREMRGHLEESADELSAVGMARDQAMSEAIKNFGRPRLQERPTPLLRSRCFWVQATCWVPLGVLWSISHYRLAVIPEALNILISEFLVVGAAFTHIWAGACEWRRWVRNSFAGSIAVPVITSLVMFCPSKIVHRGWHIDDVWSEASRQEERMWAGRSGDRFAEIANGLREVESTAMARDYKWRYYPSHREVHNRESLPFGQDPAYRDPHPWFYLVRAVTSDELARGLKKHGAEYAQNLEGRVAAKARQSRFERMTVPERISGQVVATIQVLPAGGISLVAIGIGAGLGFLAHMRRVRRGRVLT